MAVTYGFYNSVSGDRKYDARQMASIFDGVIVDGVYQSIGTALIVTASSGLQVRVGIGRAWFNHTWTLNDAVLPLTLAPADVVLSRIDAVILEVDSRDAARSNSIRVVTGTPSSSPLRPTLANSDTVHQYPLAYVAVAPGATSVQAADITNMVGTSSTPFVTGILQGMNIDTLVTQWGGQWAAWFEDRVESADSDIASWVSGKQSQFDSWYASLVNTLSTNQAANLAAQILELQNTIQTFATEQAIYRPLTDSSGNAVLDASGNQITGRLIYSML